MTNLCVQEERHRDSAPVHETIFAQRAVWAESATSGPCHVHLDATFSTACRAWITGLVNQPFYVFSVIEVTVHVLERDSMALCVTCGSSLF